MDERRCKALPDCGRPVTAKGLCQSHYRQALRGEPFRPVGRLMVGGRMVGLRVRVNSETQAALGPHPQKQARLVLEEWARRRASEK